MLIIAGDAHPALARALAHACGASLVPAHVAAFADGETRVRIEGDVEGAEVCIVQPTSPPVNERLMALVLAADAARAAGAARVVAVVPYFGYARQDARGPGEPRSAQLAARLLACAGVDRVITVELHSAALESAFPMPVANLRADALLEQAIARWRLAPLAVVSPDAGGLKRAQRLAAALGAALAVVAKSRPRPDVAEAHEVLGEVRGRACVIVDDLASTGSTAARAAEALRAAGAAEVHAALVHAVMAPGALERMKAAGIGRIAVTDTVGEIAEPRLEALPVAPLIAQALA